MEGVRRITATLDKPIKRVGLIVLVLGILLTLIGIFQIGDDQIHYRWFEKTLGVFGEALLFDHYTYRRYPLACVGPYVLLFGLLCSFLYDRTLGHLFAWIRHG